MGRVASSERGEEIGRLGGLGGFGGSRQRGLGVDDRESKQLNVNSCGSMRRKFGYFHCSVPSTFLYV